MGYQRSILKLKFQDPEFEGLEVTCRRMRIGDLAAITRLSGVDKDASPEEHAKALDDSVNRLGEHLVSWNLEDDSGVSVPCTVEALREQDLPFVQAVMSAWMDVAVGVSAPLKQPSEDGSRSVEGSIPMETL